MWIYEYTIEDAGISVQQVWAAYQDVSAWSSWDSELESASLLGDFNVDSEIIIKPKKGPKVNAIITECVPYECFTDVAVLPFNTKLIFSHRIEKNNDKVRLTHRVSIEGPLTFIFKRLIGKSIQNHIPIAMIKLVQLTKGVEV